MRINFGWKTVAAVVGGVLLLDWVAEKKIADAAGAVGDFVTDADNPINSTANGVFRQVSGNHVDSIGTWLYGLLHPNYGEAWTTPTPLNWQHSSPPRGG